MSYHSYKHEILPKLMKEKGYINPLQVPRLIKIVINTGISSNKPKDFFDEASTMLADISGQRPLIARARKSIAGFKIRQGDKVGLFVTLRGKRMYDFFYRLVNIALPRVHDFRGVSTKSFDNSGNYTLGFDDQTIFTEINLDKMKYSIGMHITIINTAKTKKEAHALLQHLGFPFRQVQQTN